MVIHLNFRFTTPHQYLFIHQHIKHLLLLWEKERRKEIYIIKEEQADELLLHYPGETYMEMVLQELEAVFFQTLATETEEFEAVLGATFVYQNKLIGMYYHKNQLQKLSPFFFEIVDEQLKEIPDEDYEDVAKKFSQEFPEYTE